MIPARCDVSLHPILLILRLILFRILRLPARQRRLCNGQRGILVGERARLLTNDRRRRGWSASGSDGMIVGDGQLAEQRREQRIIDGAIVDEPHEGDTRRIAVAGTIDQRQLDQVVVGGVGDVSPVDALPAPRDVGGPDGRARQRAILDLLPRILGPA